MLKRRLLAATVIAVAVLTLIYADHPGQSGSRNATVLIISHAEKPGVQEHLLLGDAGDDSQREWSVRKVTCERLRSVFDQFPVAA